MVSLNLLAFDLTSSGFRGIVLKPQQMLLQGAYPDAGYWRDADLVYAQDTSTAAYAATVLAQDDPFNRTIQITLSEPQRATAIANSATPGGDGTALLFDGFNLAVRDVGTNANADNTGLTITETADTVQPVATAARIHYGTGVLTLTASETLMLAARLRAVPYEYTKYGCIK